MTKRSYLGKEMKGRRVNEGSPQFWLKGGPRLKIRRLELGEKLCKDLLFAILILRIPFWPKLKLSNLLFPCVLCFGFLWMQALWMLERLYYMYQTILLMWL